jgi:phosphoribosylformylglycinamidine synthase
MIHFFENQSKTVFAVQTQTNFSSRHFKTQLAFCRRTYSRKIRTHGFFVEPRAAMVTHGVPMEITQNMGFLELLELKNSKSSLIY